MMDKQKVEAFLRETLPGVDFNAGVPLEQAGLSSLDILIVVSQIYAKFGVRIPSVEMKRENFESVETIFQMIERNRKG